MTIRLTIDTENRLFRTRFVFACNNPEELDYFRLHGRQCIEAGNLALYLAKPLSKWGTLRLGLRLLAGKTDEVCILKWFARANCNWKLTRPACRCRSMARWK